MLSLIFKFRIAKFKDSGSIEITLWLCTPANKENIPTFAPTSKKFELASKLEIHSTVSGSLI